MIADFRKKMAASPEYARFAPFFIFCLITSAGFFIGKDWMFWLYALKVFVGLWLIWEMRSIRNGNALGVQLGGGRGRRGGFCRSGWDWIPTTRKINCCSRTPRTASGIRLRDSAKARRWHGR